VIQGVLADLGWTVLGAPRWDLGPLLPSSWLLPLEQAVMGPGWLVSLFVAYHLAAEDAPERPWRAFLPWASRWRCGGRFWDEDDSGTRNQRTAGHLELDG
jgi:hypothetical protein